MLYDPDSRRWPCRSGIEYVPASHRVLAIDRRWVDQGADSFWSVCVDYLERTERSEGPARGGARNRIDYRERLPPEQFAAFAGLREWRVPPAWRITERASLLGAGALPVGGSTRVCYKNSSNVVTRLEPGEPGRQLEQHRCELPDGEPQQERADEPEQHAGISRGLTSGIKTIVSSSVNATSCSGRRCDAFRLALYDWCA